MCGNEGGCLFFAQSPIRIPAGSKPGQSPVNALFAVFARPDIPQSARVRGLVYGAAFTLSSGSVQQFPTTDREASVQTATSANTR